MTLTGATIFQEKLTGGLKNDTRNLVSFHVNRCKTENLLFDELVFFKAYKVLEEKVQKSLMTLKSDPKKSSFLRNMHFVCDAIDLKQSVEGTLKV